MNPDPIATAVATLPHDLTPLGMFMAADLVVKAVMAGLLLASLVTWIILFGKVVELAALGRAARRGVAAVAVEPGTSLLATIGSTAPFIGLFGTVWGIMNAFVGISESQTTNLAVVAPGIAEALLATATGLVAAIPAVATAAERLVRRVGAFPPIPNQLPAPFRATVPIEFVRE